MAIIGLLELLCWVVFIVVWFVTALASKRNLTPKHWWQAYWVRVIIFILIFLFFRSQIDSLAIRYKDLYHANLIVASIGLLLTALGIAFAIWARVNIGRNWGMPMTLKENRELVTSGPYTFVRHPIYSGMLLAVIGSTLVVGIWWIPVLALVAIYFIYSAISEERTLTKEFPEAYPAYKKHTKMLIPFIL